MSHFSLQARWVLPVERPPIAGGVVSIADGKIAAVGDRSTSEGPRYDLGDVVLMPGLVNAHTHLEFSQLDEPLGRPGMSLPEWIRLVISNRRRARQNINPAILAGLRESLRHGVTTVGDIATTPLSIDEGVPRPHLVSFQEAIGFSGARVDSVLVDIEQRIKKTPLTTWGLSPHAPYTVHPRLLERLVNLACRERLPLAMHLAESPEELEFLASGSGLFRELLAERSMWDAKAIPLGTKPLDYLKVLARAPRSLAVHGNYFSTPEIQYLATQRERMSVVYCPRTHDFFEHTEYPLPQMLAAGVRVALGTDSRASNPDLSLLDEMRFVANRYPGIATTEILAMGTLAAAEALGLEGEIGSIAPGKWADLVAAACDAESHDPETAVLHSSAGPTRIWLRGQTVL